MTRNIRPLFMSISLGAMLDTHVMMGQGRDPLLSAEARAYLSTVLDTLEAVTLRADTIDWKVVRDSAFLLAHGARKTSDTYGAIEWAARRANKHSFLQAPAPGAVSELVRGAFGYIHIPMGGGPQIAMADSLHNAVRTLQDAGACGWIVDLRDNGGGNMWPMLAGIGPLLGDTLVGYFGAERWFYSRGVSGILKPDGKIDTVSKVTVHVVELRQRAAPVALLFNRFTGSSGEAVSIAFIGRQNFRSFGTPSAGYTTVNRGSRLADGANLVVTTGYDADRLGVLHVGRLQPETEVADNPQGWPFATDRVAEVAANWLSQQPACRTRH